MNLPHREPSLSGDFMEGEGTFFRAHNNAVKESISNEQFSSFCDLKTEDARVKFVYDLDIIHKTDLPTSPFKKNAQNALNYKNHGNTFFGNQNYGQAARIYGLGLLDCPTDEDLLLSTLYANRSAPLYHMTEYHKALEDIDFALSLSYPENLHHKVLERKARCHLALNELDKAIQAFKNSLTALDKSGLNLPIRQKKEADFSIMIDLLTKTLAKGQPLKKRIGPKSFLPPVPEVSHGKNKIYPSASSVVGFTNQPTEGRFAIANTDIEPGEILVVEKSHCATLLFEYSKSHCQHCFCRVAHPIPCPNCPNVIFCSAKCRKSAINTYHKYECSFLGSLLTSGASIVCCLAIRLITQRGIKYFLDLKAKLGKELQEGETYNVYDYNNVYNLCRHEKLRSNSDFFQRATMTTILLRFLQKSNFFGTEPTRILTENEQFIGGLLLHNLQFLQFNAHEIAELQYSADYPGDVTKAQSRFIGGGLFPTLALFNHSCEPGIVRYFSGSKVIVRSVKSIVAGDMIAENYGPIYTQTNRKNRQLELSTQYWFNCQCVPCSENWPVFDDMTADVFPFRCIKSKTCYGLIKVGINTEEFMFKCPKCAEMICIFGSLRSLNDTEAMFNQGERLIKDHKYNDSLKIFIKIMKILDMVLKAPYRDFCLCQQKIRSSMLTLGNSYQPHAIKRS